MKLRPLDLFSGIGGFSLGLERTGGFETVAFCEIDPFCRKVLAKHWPDVPIFEDVRELSADAIGPVDIITGGYPCQPFSEAGQRRGEEDDRHLWPEMYRLVAEFGPGWVIGETVFGHLSLGLDQVLSDLAAEDYTARAFIIPACAVNAPHRRNRVWIVAHAASQWQRKSTQPIDSERQSLCPPKRKESPFGVGSSGPFLANAASKGQSHNKGSGPFGKCTGGRAPDNEGCGSGTSARWLPEPDVGRVATRVPADVDRLRALGNAVVPQIPEMIGHAILKAEAA